MQQILLVFSVVLSVFFYSCGENENDYDLNDEINDEKSDDDSNEPQQLQTGGIVIFDNLHSNSPGQHTILGNGGFFGYSVFRFNNEYWGVSALHESIPPYDFEKASGALYIMGLAKGIDGIEIDSALKLYHPDRLINAGFGFTTAGACDINNDGIDDIVVSAHLAIHGDLYAAGEFVVFYGNDLGWNEENTSISRVSEGLIQKADSMSQSLVCGDINGDGFADVLAGGQNAGPELATGGSQGMVAFFKGSADGLEKNESWILLPKVEKKGQYFGSSMILEDLNGDKIQDLIVSGWGLKESDESVNTGGVYIYFGGSEWQQGPSKEVFGTKDSQFGSVIKLVKVEEETLLGVIAPNVGKNGTIYFYNIEDMTEKFKVTVPETVEMGIDVSFSDFDTILDGTETMLVAGGKNFKDGGRILCGKINSESVEELAECPWQPEITNGGFGFSVKNIGNIDSTSKGDELIVGMPEYIWTVTE